MPIFRSLMTILIIGLPWLLFADHVAEVNPSEAATSFSAENNLKFLHAKRIFEKLVEAKGDRSRITPVLNWTEDRGNGAYFEVGSNRITMEAAAYDVCATFGDRTDDAIAYILSHELIHYYKNHGWEGDFARRFSGTDVAVEVDETTRDIKQQETESDLQGGFLAYTAGFNTVGMAPEFLPRLYEAYPKWPREKSSKYPSLQERIDIATTTMKDLETLIRVFETANYLVVIERYEAALEMYNYVLSKYVSRELLNNIGVVHCMTAINIMGKEVIKYAYPLELDAEARLKLGTKGISGFGDEMATSDSLLRIGIKHFHEAHFLDETYNPAILNLGCAYAIRALANYTRNEETQQLYYDYASIYARDAKQRALRDEHTKLEGDAITLMGIVAAETGTGDPEALFDDARAKTGLASVNLSIFKGEPLPSSGRRMGMGLMSEQIEAFDLDGYTRRPATDTLIQVNKSTSRKWGIKRKGLDYSHVLVDFIDRNNWAFIHVTKSNYTGSNAKTLEGIRLGMSQAEVMDKYLTPDRVIQLPTGAFLAYPANNIVFRFDGDELIEWAVYRKKPEE